MGLDTSHGCWHGSYSDFMRWRQAIAEAAGLPPLSLMEGYFACQSLRFRGDGIGDYLRDVVEQLPISWEVLKPNALHELLHHSDCSGYLPWESCGPIADELEKLLPKLEEAVDFGCHIDSVAEKTRTFITGLRAASEARENVDFH